MRRHSLFALVLLLVSVPAVAGQPRCPLTLDSCVAAYGRMRHQVWLGVRLEPDSLGRRVVEQLVRGGAAEAAGVREGDVIESFDGRPAPEFLAGRAGWKTGQRVRTMVTRGGERHEATLTVARMTDDELARLMGDHMIEAHLAYMPSGGAAR